MDPEMSGPKADVAHTSRRAVSPFVATCLVGAPAPFAGRWDAGKNAGTAR